MVKEITTQDDGAFSFTKEGEDEGYRYGVILAEKEGLAIGWANWRMREDKHFEIELRVAKKLAGLVVDDNDKPIAEAEVSICILFIGEGDDQLNPTHSHD